MALSTHLPEEQPAPADCMDDRSIESFSRMYERYFPRLVVVCRRRLPERTDDAEAIAQEAFLRAWASIDSYAGGRPFWPWVSTIARRLCVDYVRQTGRDARIRRRTRAERRVPFNQPEDVLDELEERRSAMLAFAQLSAKERRLISLRDIERWSYEEIAAFEGTSLESVRSGLKRARIALRDAYRRLEGRLLSLPPFVAVARARTRTADLAARVPALFQGAVSLREVMAGLAALSLALGAMLSSGMAREPAAGAGTVAMPPSPPSVTAASNSASPPTSVPGSSSNSDDGGGSRPPVAQPQGRSDAVASLLPATAPEADHVDDAGFDDVEAAPDGTLFATGQARDCTAVCKVVFRSTDRGVTWQRLAAKGYLGGLLMIPPAYPRDPRIFAGGGVNWYRGLQVSEDHGETFRVLSPLAGPTAVAPGFGTDDSRIFVGATPGYTYDVSRGETSPLGMDAATTGHPHMTFAFSPTYGTDGVFFVGGVAPVATLSGLGYRSTVFRCEGAHCVAVAEGLTGAVSHIALSPRFAEDGRAWAWSSYNLWQSTDGGRTFRSLPVETHTYVNQVVVTEDAAYVLRSLRRGGFQRTFDDGATWEPIGRETFPSGVTRFALLPGDGMVVISGGRLLWSADDGRTWHAAR